MVNARDFSGKKSAEEIRREIEKTELELARLGLEAAPAPRGRRAVWLAACAVMICVLISVAVIATVAYFSTEVTSEGNRITVGGIEVALFGDESSSEVITGNFEAVPGVSVPIDTTAKNVGAFPLYVRAKIKTEIALDEAYAEYSDEIDPSVVVYEMNTEGWTERDGYYYYNRAISAGEATPNILSAVGFHEDMDNIYKDSIVTVTVRLEIVQASGNGASALEATGWPTPEEGGEPL